MVKVARRYQVTIPEEIREKAKISVGDDMDVRYEDGTILLENQRIIGKKSDEGDGG